ncbi:MAG TPA: hypothetical protein DDW82_04875 [Acholeplasmataceae bacterium]|nr:hypothetical protein [Acholeplasmataceae bacterium]
MKKVWIVLLLLASVMNFSLFETNAETLEYPFDEIRIVEAFKFDIIILSVPDDLSLLKDHVEINDVLTVYVGTLVLVQDGIANSSQTHMMILTTSSDIDLARWIVNSGSWTDIEEWLEFSNHIQINPEIGVVKDLSIPLIQIGYRKNITLNTYTFYDNTGNDFPMVPGSLEIETGLSIIISAYVPVEE